jgi:hypothetical protein
MPSLDSLKTLKTLQVDDKTYHYFSLPEAAKSLGDLKTCCAGRTRKPSPALISRRLPPGSRSAAPIAKSSTGPRGY